MNSFTRLREELELFEREVAETNEAHRKEVEELKREHEEVVAKLVREHEEETEKLKDEISLKDNEIQSLKVELDTFIKARDTYASAVTCLEAALETLKERHEDTLKGIQGRLSDMERENTDAFAKFKEEVAILRDIGGGSECLDDKRYDSLLEERRELKAIILGKNAEIEEYRSFIESNSFKHANELKKVYEEHENEINCIKNEHREELSKLADKYTAEIDVFKEEAIKEIKAKHEEEIKKKDEKYIETKKKLIEYNEEAMKKLKESHDSEIRRIVEKHKGEIAKRDAEIASLKEENKTNKERYIKEVDELKAKHEEETEGLKAEHEKTLKKLVEQHEEAINSLKTEYEESKKKDEEYRTSTEEYTEEKKKFIEDNEETMKKLKEFHDSEIRNIVEKHEGEIIKKDTEIASLKEENESKEQCVKEVNRLKKETETSKKSIRELTNKQKELENELTTKTSVVKIKETEIAKLKKDADEKTRELTKLRRENAEYVSKVDRSKTNAVAARTALKKKDDEVDALNKEKKKCIEIEKKNKELKAENDELRTHNLSLKASIETYRKINEEEVENLKKSEAHAKKMSDEIKLLEAEIEIMKKYDADPDFSSAFDFSDDNFGIVGSPAISTIPDDTITSSKMNKNYEIMVKKMTDLIIKLKDHIEAIEKDSLNKDKIISKYRESTLRNIDFQIKDTWIFIRRIEDIIREIGAFKDFISKNVENVDLRAKLTTDIVDWNKIVVVLKPYAQKMTGILSGIERTITIEFGKYNETKEENLTMANKVKVLEKEQLKLKDEMNRKDELINSLRKKASVTGTKAQRTASVNTSVSASHSASVFSSRFSSRSGSRAASPPPGDDFQLNVTPIKPRSPMVNLLHPPESPTTTRSRHNSHAPLTPTVTISALNDSSLQLNFNDDDDDDDDKEVSVNMSDDVEKETERLNIALCKQNEKTLSDEDETQHKDKVSDTGSNNTKEMLVQKVKKEISGEVENESGKKEEKEYNIDIKKEVEDYENYY